MYKKRNLSGRGIKWLVVVAWICIYSINSFAQVAQTKRVEIELKDEYSGQKVYLFGEKGLILLSKTYEPAAGEIQLKFEHFTTDLEKTSDKDIAIEYFKGYNITFTDENRLWIFFHNYKKGTFVILEFDPVTGKVERHKGTTVRKFEANFFRVLNGRVFLAGKYKNKPMMSIINLKDMRVDYPHLGEMSKRFELTNLKITDDQEQVHLILNVCRGRNNCRYVFYPFDKEGKKLARLIEILDDPENKLVTCSTTGLRSGEFMAAGTFSERKYNTAQGVYITGFNEQQRKYIQFYNFLDFKNFLTYLPERRQDRIKRKKQRKKARGKELKLNYRMVIHDLIEGDNEVIFVGEAYYPTYRTETYTSLGTGGSQITRTRSVFDGYQFSHSAIAAFDLQGNMKWSNTFEMWLQYKPFILRRFLSVNLDETTGNISLMFATGAKIKSIAFNKFGEEMSSRDVEIVKTGDDNDKLRWTSSSNVKHWYGNAYLADGFQKIVNKERKFGNRRRKVYFLNKVVY